MPESMSRWIATALALAALASSPSAQKSPAVDDVLKVAADYLDSYAQQLSVVAGEEEYTQYDTASGRIGVPRRLTSDVALVGVDGAVMSFRDVAAIDNKPVRARDDRLLALLKGQDAARLIRAHDVAEAGLRYYISQDLHALDDPLLALEFLRKANQARSTFKVDGVKTVNGARVVVLKFTEQSTPRLIPSPENAPAMGKFWIDVEAGTVRQTEISISGRASSFHAVVKYSRDPAIGLWLPSEMTQDTRQTAQGSGMNNMGGGGGYGAVGAAEAHATYSKYRR
jgi:hypothetical protein